MNTVILGIEAFAMASATSAFSRCTFTLVHTDAIANVSRRKGNIRIRNYPCHVNTNKIIYQDLSVTILKFPNLTASISNCDAEIRQIIKPRLQKLKHLSETNLSVSPCVI